MNNKIAIACDHGGFETKENLKKDFPDVEWLDLGTNSTDSVDYPDFAAKVVDAIIGGQAGRGVIICGSGIGVSIMANRNKDIRAALCTSADMARLCREHNDANVICFGERISNYDVISECLKIFLETKFEGGRHERRVQKLGA